MENNLFGLTQLDKNFTVVDIFTSDTPSFDIEIDENLFTLYNGLITAIENSTSDSGETRRIIYHYLEYNYSNIDTLKKIDILRGCSNYLMNRISAGRLENKAIDPMVIDSFLNGSLSILY